MRPDVPRELEECFSEGVPGAHGTCSTNGHYICDECVYRATTDCCGRRPMHCECAPIESKVVALGKKSFAARMRSRRTGEKTLDGMTRPELIAWMTTEGLYSDGGALSDYDTEYLRRVANEHQRQEGEKLRRSNAINRVLRHRIEGFVETRLDSMDTEAIERIADEMEAQFS